MNSQPLVSIITPSFNSKKYIKATIASVFSQSCTNWEMIVVDDCSTDGSADYISDLVDSDARISLICLDKNVGPAEARNIAFASANGKYIAFLDADDLWMPDKLEKQLSFMIENDYAFSFTAYTPFIEGSNVAFPRIDAPAEIDYIRYCKNTIVGCLTVIINREKTGDFRMKNLRSSHDMALWLEIMKRGFKAYGLNENLARYRLVADSNTANKVEAAKDVWQVYRKVEKLSLIKSVWYFANYAFNAIKKRR